MGTAMGRTLPKLIVLAGIALVVIAIYVTVQRLAARPEPGVIYIDPGIGVQNP